MQMFPEMIVACANADLSVIGQNLLQPEALARRFDIQLETFKQYDPKRPDEVIFRVKGCNYYTGLIGTELTFKQAKTLITVIHKRKKDTFKNTKETMAKEMVAAFESIKEPYTKNTLKLEKNPFLENGDFMKDFETYIDGKEETCLS